MEDEQGCTGALFKNARVEAHFFPGGKLFWLALRQPRFHRKLGFREVQGAFQVHSFRHLAGFANPFLERPRHFVAGICSLVLRIRAVETEIWHRAT